MKHYIVSFARVTVYREYLHTICMKNNFFDSEEKTVNHLCKDIIERLFSCEKQDGARNYLNSLKHLAYIDKLKEILKYFKEENFNITTEKLELVSEISSGQIKYLSRDRKQSYMWNIDIVIDS